MTRVTPSIGRGRRLVAALFIASLALTPVAVAALVWWLL
ncbi:hypothetical protein SUDANB145_01391 [Streptomyces sp. enrichment culture]